MIFVFSVLVTAFFISAAMKFVPKWIVESAERSAKKKREIEEAKVFVAKVFGELKTGHTPVIGYNDYRVYAEDGEWSVFVYSQSHGFRLKLLRNERVLGVFLSPDFDTLFKERIQEIKILVQS